MIEWHALLNYRSIITVPQTLPATAAFLRKHIHLGDESWPQKEMENILNSVVGLFMDDKKADLYNIIPFVAFFSRYSSLGYADEEKAEVAKQLLSLSQASFANPTK